MNTIDRCARGAWLAALPALLGLAALACPLPLPAQLSGAHQQVVRVLPAADYRLASVEATLRTSGAWRPIAHAAWVQTAANWGTHIGIALSDLGVSSPGLSGTVYLERATYLHLGVDLSLNAGGIN